jgi:glycosyltransferase involved in cell wall biosynthesis
VVERVLVMTPAYPHPARPYYGAFVGSEVEALRAAGLQVDVLAVNGYVGKGEYAKGALRTLALNGNGRYDVVHAFYGLMGLVGRLQVRAPLVVSFTGGDLNGDPDETGALPRVSRIKARSYAAAALFAAATITQSDAMVRLLPASRRARNRVIPFGVDLERFEQHSRDDARARLGWDPDEPTVVFMARPERPVKNFSLAQAAMERVPGARLRVSGTTPPSEVPLWMAAADVLLLTSHSEGSPNVIKEAMAAQLPLVSTPVGDVPALVEGVSGCYVRPPDPEALAEGIELALAHGPAPEARAAVSHLDRRRTTPQVLEVYESAVNGGG